jgi:hypothetical protein
MWEPRRLTILWTSMACYRDSFTYFLPMLHSTVCISLLLLSILSYSVSHLLSLLSLFYYFPSPASSILFALFIQLFLFQSVFFIYSCPFFHPFSLSFCFLFRTCFWCFCYSYLVLLLSGSDRNILTTTSSPNLQSTPSLTIIYLGFFSKPNLEADLRLIPKENSYSFIYTPPIPRHIYLFMFLLYCHVCSLLLC